MTVLLTTTLTVEQCNEYLRNGIDPIPPSHERLRSSNNTTWAPDPLPGAGRRTSGFGYSLGTRPVVGTITDGQFRLEKRVVQTSFGRGSNAPPAVIANCIGRLTPTAHGALIEIDMERPASGQAFIVIVGLFAVVFGLLGLSLLLTYLSGSYVSATPGDAGTGMGPCVLLLMFLIPVSMLAVGVQSGQTEREYLLKFVKQVCEATPFEVPATDTGSGYTGKTHRLS